MTQRALIAAATLVTLYGCGGVDTEVVLKRPADPSPPAAPRATPALQRTQGASPQAPQPPLRPELSPAEEQRLAEGARQDIGDAARVIAELEARPLKPPQKEALQNAKNFLDQAQTALGQRDYPRAANLASKARALTDDLAATSK
jgi:hypothetical protein